MLGWLAGIAIVVLSVVPGNERPHTGLPGYMEHVIAYLITSTLFTLAHPTRRNSAIVAVALSLLAGAMEILQLYIPGRHSSFDDFAVSSVGAIIGVVLTLLFIRYLHDARQEHS